MRWVSEMTAFFATRFASLGACHWLSYSAPSALGVLMRWVSEMTAFFAPHV
jgi:hypothetical protein